MPTISIRQTRTQVVTKIVGMVIFSLVGLAGSALAGTITWQGGTGNWFDASWNLDGSANHAWDNGHDTYIGNVGATPIITMNGYAAPASLHLSAKGSINVNGQGLTTPHIYVEDADVFLIMGNNGHAGGFTLESGHLQFGNGGDEKPCGGNMIVYGGTLDLRAQPSTGNTIVGNLTVNAGLVRYYFANQLDDTKLLYVKGGTLDIATFNDTVAGVQVTAGSIVGFGGTLTSASAFDMQGGTVNAKLGGTSGLNKTTSGTVNLYGANSYTGNTAINDGTLVLGGTIAGGSTIVVGNGGAGGTLELLQSANANTLTLNGGTVSALGLDADPGTGGVVTYSGNSVIRTFNASGNLNLSSEVLGAKALIVGGGGGGGGGVSGVVYDSGGGGGQVLNLSELTLPAGDNAVVVAGQTPNKSTDGGPSSFVGHEAGGGKTTITGGVGGTSGSGNAGGGKNGTAAGGGGGDSAIGKDAASGIGGNGGNGTPNSVIPGLAAYYGGGGGGRGGSGNGAGGLGGGGAGQANGTLNTGGGGGGSGNGGSGIVIVSYELPIVPGACTLSGTITVPVTSTLDALGTGGRITVASTMTGVGGIKIASTTDSGGVVIFAAQQDYSGGTTIDSGTLLANHATQGTGTGAVTVKSGGTLGGNGAITGAVTVENGGHLSAAGANAIGTLTLSADNTSLNVNDGAVLDFEISGSDASPVSDLIDLTGTDSTIAFGSSATLNVLRLADQTINPIGKTFVLFQYTGAAPTLPTTWTINYSNPLWTGGSVQIDGQTIVLTGVSMLENHAPTDIALAPSTVAENSAMGTEIGTLSTTDENVGDAFTYTLVAGDGDGDNGLVSIDGDKLKVNGAIDFETNPTLEIRVQTEDMGGLTFTKALVVTVTDVNEAPTNLALSQLTVSENSPVGRIIGTLSTTDADAGDTFTYTLVAGAGDGDNALVAIDGDTLKVNGALSHAGNPTLEIRVQTQDAGALTFSKALVITVTENDSPRMVAAGSVAPGHTLVGTVKAVDPNPEDTLTYSVSGGANADLFEIVGDVLSMKAAPLPGDLGNVYYVEVQVSDGMATDRMLIEVTVSASATQGTIFLFK